MLVGKFEPVEPNLMQKLASKSIRTHEMLLHCSMSSIYGPKEIIWKNRVVFQITVMCWLIIDQFKCHNNCICLKESNLTESHLFPLTPDFWPPLCQVLFSRVSTVCVGVVPGSGRVDVKICLIGGQLPHWCPFTISLLWIRHYHCHLHILYSLSFFLTSRCPTKSPIFLLQSLEKSLQMFCFGSTNSGVTGGISSHLSLQDQSLLNSTFFFFTCTILKILHFGKSNQSRG